MLCYVSQTKKLSQFLLLTVRPKKNSNLVSRYRPGEKYFIGRVKNISSLTRLHNQMCIRIYIFNLKKKQEDK